MANEQLTGAPAGEDDRAAEVPMHYMYVVECADGTLYTGYSPDVQARVAAHNAGRGARYTRSRGPVRLVASAAFADKHQAMSAEWHFKRLTRAQKDALLARAASGEPFEDVLLQTILRPEDDSSTED